MGTSRTQSVAYFSAAADADLLCDNKVYHAYFMRVNVAVIKCLKDSRTGILIHRSLQIPHMDVCVCLCVCMGDCGVKDLPSLARKRKWS